MAALPDCECIYGLPLNDKLDAIYCYLYQHATSTVSLPSCECVRGYPPMDKVSAIYCALLQLNTGGGSITLSQISDMSAFWKNANAQTPAASTYLTSNGAGVFAAVPFANISITASQISDSSQAGRSIVTTLMPPGAGTAPIIIDSSSVISVQPPFTDGVVSPVTAVGIQSGIVTLLS